MASSIKFTSEWSGYKGFGKTSKEAIENMHKEMEKDLSFLKKPKKKKS